MCCADDFGLNILVEACWTSCWCCIFWALSAVLLHGINTSIVNVHPSCDHFMSNQCVVVITDQAEVQDEIKQVPWSITKDQYARTCYIYLQHTFLFLNLTYQTCLINSLQSSHKHSVCLLACWWAVLMIELFSWFCRMGKRLSIQNWCFFALVPYCYGRSVWEIFCLFPYLWKNTKFLTSYPLLVTHTSNLMRT